MHTSIRKTLRRLALAAGLALPAVASAGYSASYSQIYVLGDSLSDVGNIEAAYAPIVAANGGVPLPILGLTAPGTPSAYAPNRASNGPIWIDAFAGAFGFSSVASLAGGTNYAFGGARTDNQLYNPVIPDFLGLLQQRDALLAARPALDPDALYVVWGGANNLQDILTGRPRADGTPQSVGQTVADLADIIDSLAAAGASHFLVPNAPNIGLVPRLRERGPLAVAYGTQLTAALNGGLAALIDSRRQAGLDILGFDAAGFLDEVVANPASYGLANVTERCYTGDDLNFNGSGGVCTDPASYLFWDGIHPTTTGHALLAQAMLQHIPEPATASLLLGALAAAACNSRRIRQEPRRSLC
ncbi:MAG: SGNH/GDSL hydrolase family protein [Zoogloea sp.]|nr:SGNH/GDSL hydrolase family protein [Zoogloea sp.]